MGSFTQFLKTTALGGLLVLLPLLLLYLMLGQMLQAVIALATPIAELVIPGDELKGIHFPVVLAVVLILAASFLLGLLARARIAKRFGGIIERHTLGALPLYGVLKSLTAQFAGVGDSGFRPAMVDDGRQGRAFAFLVEDHGDGDATVMFPRAPTPMVGTVRIVSRDRVQVLDISLGDFTKVLSHWGTGARELLKRGEKTA